jgi:peptidyl-prolyl cis-trans isomerase SurA
MNCLLILISFFLMLSDSLKADPSPSSRITAVVDKNIITQADLLNRLRLAAISSGLEPTLENFEKIKPQMIRVMIDETIQRQVGDTYKIEVKDEQISGAIGRLEESNGMPKGGIAQLMKDNNIPLKTLQDQIRANLIWIEYIRAKYTPTLQIADWEIEQERKLQKEKESKTQYHLAEIVLPFDGAEQEERVKTDLNRLVEELQKGASFSVLAQQFSQSATAAQGGDMGWLTEDQLAPEVKEYVSHMEPGELSQPIRTPVGYVIIGYIEKKLPGSEGEVLLTLQHVMVPFPQDITEDQALAIMRRVEEIAKSAKSCSELEKRTKDKFPSAVSRLSQGESLANLPGPLQKVVGSLELHKASAPLLTESGALLVMACDKKTRKTEELTEEEIKETIAERKLSLLARRELRDLRRHAFIEMRNQ